MIVKKYNTHLGNEGSIFTSVTEVLEIILGRQLHVNRSPKHEDGSEMEFGKTLQKSRMKREQCESYDFLNDGIIPIDYINWLWSLMLIFKPRKRLKDEKWTGFKARLGSTVSYNSAGSNM